MEEMDEEAGGVCVKNEPNVSAPPATDLSEVLVGPGPGPIAAAVADVR